MEEWLCPGQTGDIEKARRGSGASLLLEERGPIDKQRERGSGLLADIAVHEKTLAVGGNIVIGATPHREKFRWHQFCLNSQIVAGTNPGDRLVRVCGTRFKSIARTDSGYAAALVIHEELHSLGLPANPPSSDAITRKVVELCGR